MISWGVRVNDFGNAIMTEDGKFDKVPGEGLDDALWNEMTAYADANGISGGNYKKLNLPFERRWQGQDAAARERMVVAVEDFVHHLLVEVFNASDTAPIACDLILKAGSYDPRPQGRPVREPGRLDRGQDQGTGRRHGHRQGTCRKL